MNRKFDELAKGLAQSTTRRQALKKFGVGLAGMAMACFGLANRVEVGKDACKACLQWCKKTHPSADCGVLCSNACSPLVGA